MNKKILTIHQGHTSGYTTRWMGPRVCMWVPSSVAIGSGPCLYLTLSSIQKCFIYSYTGAYTYQEPRYAPWLIYIFIIHQQVSVLSIHDHKIQRNWYDSSFYASWNLRGAILFLWQLIRSPNLEFAPNHQPTVSSMFSITVSPEYLKPLSMENENNNLNTPFHPYVDISQYLGATNNKIRYFESICLRL